MQSKSVGQYGDIDTTYTHWHRQRDSERERMVMSLISKLSVYVEHTPSSGHSYEQHVFSQHFCQHICLFHSGREM